jgi:hypothetical protein
MGEPTSQMVDRTDASPWCRKPDLRPSMRVDGCRLEISMEERLRDKRYPWWLAGPLFYVFCVSSLAIDRLDG